MDIICRNCKKKMGGMDSFCSTCGARKLLVRSENELKIEYKKILEIIPQGLGEVATINSILLTLDWCSGGASSPSDILRQTRDKLYGRSNP